MRPLFSRRLIQFTLRRSDVHTLLAALSLMREDIRPQWQAECDDIAALLKAALAERKASRVLG